MQPLDGSESLVIDCSITMAWYFKDEITAYSNAVRAALASERAAVPALWPLEVANVLLMGERRKRSTQAKATKWLRFLSALPIAVDTQTPGLAFDPILSLARSHKLTAYDAAYLELAMRLGLPLAARDDALEKAAQAVGVPLFTPPGTP
jgi:predicted nucleic acid-binding protein